MGNVPKRHHFVSEMLQKRFTDEKGRLYFFDTERPDQGVQRSTPDNLFCQGHLYSEIARDGTKDPTLEKFFSTLEGRINRIIDKVVSAARQNQVPGLTPAERVLWDRFFLLQFKRVPDVHKRLALEHEAEAVMERSMVLLRERRPDQHDEIDALSTSDAKQRLIHNSKVAALAQPSPALEDMLKGRGIAVIRTARPRKSFVIGSNPVVRFTLPGHTHILDLDVEIWLPVASDVAIGVGSFAGTESILSVTEPSWIRHINEGVAHQSTRYAGCSKELLCSLSGKPYKGRD